MLKKLLKKHRDKLDSLKNNKTKAIAGLLVAALLLNSLTDNYLRPDTAAEYAETSVKIVRKDERGGGSGVILKSEAAESQILTNAHVCGVIDKGGFVIRANGDRYLIASYKLSKQHDLCLIKVKANLHVNTKVAKNKPEQYSKAAISGHPALLPHTLTHGYFSGDMVIDVMTGMRPCTKEEMQKNPFQCILGGGIPEVKNYESQLVTGTILPGSSGSAVFDENGEIAGLVFASNSRGLSYAFIVPQPYVHNFVNQEASTIEWTNIDAKVELEM